MPLANGQLITLGGAVPGVNFKDIVKQIETQLSSIAGCEINLVCFAVNRSNGKIDMAAGMPQELVVKLLEMTVKDLTMGGRGIIIPG